MARAPQNKSPATLRDGDNYRAPTATSLQRTDGCRQFSTVDDNALISQVLGTDKFLDPRYEFETTHDPQEDADISKRQEAINFHYFLQCVDIIFSRMSGIITRLDEYEYSYPIIGGVFNVSVSVQYAISGKLFCKELRGEDADQTTMDVLRIVQHYDWDVKVLITLAAFAVKDGKFWLVAQVYSTSGLAKRVGILRQMSKILERPEEAKFSAYNKFVKTVLKVTRCIFQLQKLYRELKYTTFTAHIPTAAYWTIRSIVVAASELLGIIGMGTGKEYTTDVSELSALSHKLENIHTTLKGGHDRLHDITQRKKDDEALAALSSIFETLHTDNSKTLTALFGDWLFDCYRKQKVYTKDMLRQKWVILMISDLDIHQQTVYRIAKQMYSQKREFPTRQETQFEIVWVPIVHNCTEAKKTQFFEALNLDMEWYSVSDPSVISLALIRGYIRNMDRWNFFKKPLLVVTDTRGKIVHTNALHMICVFGSQLAYPFTRERERLLWGEETWRIELLAAYSPGCKQLNELIINWIKDEKFVCLYGGEDITWIRDFTMTARSMALKTGIHLELLYLGKNKAKKKKLESIVQVIVGEKLSYVPKDWKELDAIGSFWNRLESMWQSKGQYLKSVASSSNELSNDSVLKGIMSLLSFGSTGRGWAVIGTGSGNLSMANGEHMLKSLKEYTAWETWCRDSGFTTALNEYLAQVQKSSPCPHHCATYMLPATGLMPETVVCAICARIMEKYTTFRSIRENGNNYSS